MTIPFGHRCRPLGTIHLILHIKRSSSIRIQCSNHSPLFLLSNTYNKAGESRLTGFLYHAVISYIHRRIHSYTVGLVSLSAHVKEWESGWRYLWADHICSATARSWYLGGVGIYLHIYINTQVEWSPVLSFVNNCWIHKCYCKENWWIHIHINQWIRIYIHMVHMCVSLSYARNIYYVRMIMI